MSKIEKMCESYIGRAKQEKLTYGKIEGKVENLYIAKSIDERTKTFLEFANCVYEEYQKKLNGKLDFDDLISKASEIIRDKKEETELSINAKKIKLKEFSYILIDEYQDFTKLFYELIKKIRKINPKVKLFCVGDNWQAINGFAGSKLRYFNNFSIEYFKDEADEAELKTNYRSAKEIVEVGNKFAKKSCKCCSKNDEDVGKVIICKKAFVEMRDKDETKEQFENDKCYNFSEENGWRDPDECGYLKKCCEIIEEKDNKDKKIVILTRTNKFYKRKIEELLKKIIDITKVDEKKISISTIHRFKGKEADVVIVLKVCEGLFPLVHKEYVLFEKIFNQSLKDILDEEERLFYVAISRAKSKLYLVTEKEKESEYLNSEYFKTLKDYKFD